MHGGYMYKNVFLIFALLLLVVPSVAFADCADFKVTDCKSCGCVLNASKDKCIYSNIVNANGYKSCGNGFLTEIPQAIPSLTHIAYNIIQVLIPVLLVIFCSIDLVKSVVAGKEDEIKKNQTIVVKRLIASVLVFFVFVVVKFVVSLTAENGNKIVQCAECFISGVCK